MRGQLLDAVRSAVSHTFHADMFCKSQAFRRQTVLPYAVQQLQMIADLFGRGRR